MLARTYDHGMNEPPETLGQRLRVLRKARGWSQQDVADRTGVRVLAVGKWERDQQNPSDPNLVTLAKLYGIDPAEIGYEPPAWTPDTPPLWAEQFHAEILARLDALTKLLTDECEHVQELETEIVKHLRKA
jgi:transcriptional regulator with XRE-family HTH domain